MNTENITNVTVFLTLSIPVGAYAIIKAEKFDAGTLLAFIFIVLLGAVIICGTGTKRD